MSAQDLIDREGMRDDLLAMANTADAEEGRVAMANMYGPTVPDRMKLERYASELAEHRTACLNAISLLNPKRTRLAA